MIYLIDEYKHRAVVVFFFSSSKLSPSKRRCLKYSRGICWTVSVTSLLTGLRRSAFLRFSSLRSLLSTSFLATFASTVCLAIPVPLAEHSLLEPRNWKWRMSRELCWRGGGYVESVRPWKAWKTRRRPYFSFYHAFKSFVISPVVWTPSGKHERETLKILI